MDETATDENRLEGPSRRSLPLLIAGPLVHLALFTLAPESLPEAARHVMGLVGWMALWWVTEPVPLAATSLLPAGLFPLLGVASTASAVAPYASEIVFLFLAGFLLAAGLEHWNAHARIAYGMIGAIGTSGRRVVLGVMVATAFISMWISNTATAAMMYPIVIAIGALFGEGGEAKNARVALLLGMAFAASIGGMGTLLGTPPNLIVAGASQELLGIEVSFVSFMMLGIPLVALLLPICWALLVFVVYPVRVSLGAEAASLLEGRRAALGSLRGGEAWTLAVFGVTALAWVMRERKSFGGFEVPGLVDVAPLLTDGAVGILGALALFVLWGEARDGSRRPLLTWREARRIPWDVLLLFGGGLSLAAAMDSTGLSQWLGEGMTGLTALPPFAIYLGLAVSVLVLSELASNTAVASMVMPLSVSLASAVDQPPLLLMLVAGFAASTGFAMPVATPPNTIVFGSGRVSVKQMAKAGLLLDVIAVVLVVIVVSTLYPVVFG